MIRLFAAIALACVFASPASSASRHRRAPVCAPIHIEGVGTVQICVPARSR